MTLAPPACLPETIGSSMDFPHHVKKDWGYELWFANHEERGYCGKELGVWPRYMCSIHQHPDKDETFLILTGRFLIETGEDGNALEQQVLGPGERLHIPTGLWHRFTAIDETLPHNKLIEVSTFHRDEDVNRLQVGGLRWQPAESLPEFP